MRRAKALEDRDALDLLAHEDAGHAPHADAAEHDDHEADEAQVVLGADEVVADVVFEQRVRSRRHEVAAQLVAAAASSGDRRRPRAPSGAADSSRGCRSRAGPSAGGPPRSMMTRAPKLNAPIRRPGSCAMTPRIVNGWPPIISRSPTRIRAARAAQGRRARRGRRAGRACTLARRRARAFRRKGMRLRLPLSSTMRATALPCSARTIVGVSIDSVSARIGASARIASTPAADLRRPGAIGLHDDVGRDHRARLAHQAVPKALDDRPERHDGTDADGDAQEEKQQPPPGGAKLAQRHVEDEDMSVGSRQSPVIRPRRVVVLGVRVDGDDLGRRAARSSGRRSRRFRDRA